MIHAHTNGLLLLGDISAFNYCPPHFLFLSHTASRCLHVTATYLACLLSFCFVLIFFFFLVPASQRRLNYQFDYFCDLLQTFLFLCSRSNLFTAPYPLLAFVCKATSPLLLGTPTKPHTDFLTTQQPTLTTQNGTNPEACVLPLPHEA